MEENTEVINPGPDLVEDGVDNKTYEQTNKKVKRKLTRSERSKPTSPHLKVAEDTPPKRLAKSIVGCLKDWGTCTVSGVGAKPNWQADKAIVLAKKELASIGISIYVDLSFIDPRPVIDGEEKTGANKIIKMTKEPL